MFSDLFNQIHFSYIFITSAIFLLGIYTAPHIVEKDVKWLLAYPRWVASLIEKYFSKRWGFLTLFLIILILNNISLFLGFLSGFLLVMPILFAFITGLNVAVVGFDLMGWKGIWHLLVNPVAWLEFPAAWISFALGLRLGVNPFLPESNQSQGELFGLLLPLYFKYVFILLFIAALLETGLIVWAQRHKDNLDL